jgi:hypothetical protein
VRALLATAIEDVVHAAKALSVLATTEELPSLRQFGGRAA